MLRTLRNKIVSRIAKRHIAGSDINNALQVCRWADNRNFSTILSLWVDDNKKKNDLDKQENFERFKSDIILLQDEKATSYYSIKLDAIDYDFGLFKALLQVARKYDVHLHVDSLNPGSASISFRFFERAAEFNDILGCTLPSRWKRSLTDIERVIDMGLSARIVKGQWKDPNDKIDCRANYLAIVDKLAGHSNYVGIATHDIPLAEKALKRLSDSDTYTEMEQFFSLPLNGIDLAKQYNCPYRIYVAYGHPAIPYNYRYALTRPALVAWMVSDFAFNFSKPWMQK